MRRSGSSSCMLLPRQESFGETLSVTILNVEQLPAYSSERFYVLSEVEQNCHSTIILPETDDEENETQETEESSFTAAEEGPTMGATTQEGEDFPPFLILYLLWRPEINARDFVETTLSSSIAKLETLTDIMPTKDERLPGSLNRTSSRISLGGGSELIDIGENSGRVTVQDEDDDEDDEPKPTTTVSGNEQNPGTLGLKQSTSWGVADAGGSKLYLVVERVCPTLDIDSAAAAVAISSNEDDDDSPEDVRQRHYQVQVDLAEHLARMIASHPYLRTVCEGITVGVSNHFRAAPGLDACMDAVLVGAKDRRKHASSSKGCIGVVASSSDDMLGLDQEAQTDAVQGVLQCRVCAEWNGRGTLQTFARRAHRAWRINLGLSPEEPRPHPFFQRKRGSSGQTDSLELDAADLVSGLMAFCFWVAVAAYLWENRKELLQRVLPRGENAL